MKPHELRKAIEDLLRQHSDGMTALELAKVLGLGKRQVAYRLTTMKNTYIDRWQRGRVGGAVSVWCLGSYRNAPKLPPQTEEERRAIKSACERKRRERNHQ